MSEIKDLSPEAAIEVVYAMESIEDIRAAAKLHGIAFSGNTGADTLKSKIVSHLETLQEKADTETKEEETPMTQAADILGAIKEDEIEVAKVPEKKGPTIDELLAMDEMHEPDPQIRRLIIRAKALRLVRVRVTNLDPADSMIPGAIISVQSKYTGKVAKYVPYGDESENGYHIPQIIYDHMKDQKFALRKEAKGGRFGVKTYKTSLVPKFSIEVLPPLTKKEIEELAALQRASQAIDN